MRACRFLLSLRVFRFVRFANISRTEGKVWIQILEKCDYLAPAPMQIVIWLHHGQNDIG